MCSLVYIIACCVVFTRVYHLAQPPVRCGACNAAKKARFEAGVAKKEAAAALPRQRCYNCGGAPHGEGCACPEPDRRADKAQLATCYTCASPEHLTRNCPNVKPKSKGACYGCGATDHVSADCPAPKAPPFCFNCGQDGHTARACDQPMRAPDKEATCFAHTRGKCTRAKKCKFKH